MPTSATKTLVVLGGFSHEGLTAAAKALGYSIVTPLLDRVLPKTWMKRAELIRDLNRSDRLAASVIYLHTALLLKASTPEYREAFLEILKQTRPQRLLIFVFQDNLDGVFSKRHPETKRPMTLEELEEELDRALADEPYSIPHEFNWEIQRLESAIFRLRDSQERREQIEDFLRTIYEMGAEVAPFFTRSDVTIRLQEFLADIDQGVFLRLFVPNGRMQADQLKGLLSVLEHYLREVERQVFSIDTRRSDQGIAYTFRSTSGVMDLQTLNDAFSRFDSFMRLCGDDPPAAAILLQQKGLANQQATTLVERYAKDYRRLINDMRHELELKTLLLKQRLESEIIETEPSASLTYSSQRTPSLLAAVTGSNIAINIGTLSIIGEQKIHTEIEHLFNGEVVYNERDKQLHALFEQHAEALEVLQCRSDLDQLKDRSTPEPTRQNAKQRLVGFLKKAAIKTGEVAEKVLIETSTRYLESLLKGGI
jgi:hypothetical protein